MKDISMSSKLGLTGLNNEITKMSPAASIVLDIFRAWSARLVLIGHGLSLCGLTFLHGQAYFPYIQNIGVVYLLLISGYLMGYKIEKHYESVKVANCIKNYARFIAEKSGRIYAGLVPALLFIWLVDQTAIKFAPDNYQFYNSFTARNFGETLLMTQMIPAFGGTLYYGSAAQLWTLSIEWWLYLLCGYIAFYCIPKCLDGHLKIWEIVIGLILLYPVLHYLYVGFVPISPLIWVLGMTVYFAQRKLLWMKGVLQTLFVLLGNVTVLLVIGVCLKNAYSVEFILCSATFLLFSMSAAQKCGIGIGRFGKVMQLAAKNSYSLYLIHYSIMEFFMRVYPQMNPVKRFWCMVLLSELLSLVFYRLFESKGKRLSDVLMCMCHLKN